MIDRYSSAALIAAAAFVGTATAAPVFYEGFDYPGGDTLGNESSWAVVSDNGVVNTTGLSYGTLPVTGGHLTFTGSSGYTLNGAAAILASEGLLDDGATLWMSALAQPKVGSNANLVVRLGEDYVNAFNQAGGSQDSLGFNYQNGSDLQGRYTNDGTEVNPGRPWVDENDVIDETTLVVIEMQWNADANAADTINYYLPDASLVLGSPVVTFADVVFTQTNFDTFSIAANSASSTWVDEIRFGGSYADVIAPIPEPSSLALLGLGGLLIARRRRG
jgi:hypothetical protein